MDASLALGQAIEIQGEKWKDNKMRDHDAGGSISDILTYFILHPNFCEQASSMLQSSTNAAIRCYTFIFWDASRVSRPSKGRVRHYWGTEIDT